MPWPQKSRTTLKRWLSTKALDRVADIAERRARLHRRARRASSPRRSRRSGCAPWWRACPPRTSASVSPCQPSRITVTSMFRMSPLSSFRSPGMPWQTTWLIEVQIDFGIAAVIQRRRHRAMGGDELVAERVERAGGDARPHMGRDHVQRLGGEAAGGAHAGEILRRVDGDASCVGSAVHVSRSVPFWQSLFADLPAAQNAQPNGPAQGRVHRSVISARTAGASSHGCGPRYRRWKDAFSLQPALEPVGCYPMRAWVWGRATDACPRWPSQARATEAGDGHTWSSQTQVIRT